MIDQKRFVRKLDYTQKGTLPQAKIRTGYPENRAPCNFF